MVEGLVKESTTFGLGVVKNAIVAVAIVIAIIVFLFVLNAGTEVAINIVKEVIDMLQYAVNALL
jgi:hypothetical protein